MIYSDSRHGSTKWVEYFETLLPSHPRIGLYTVIVSRKNHWYVEENFFYDGSAWFTAKYTPTRCVVKYDPDSWHMKEDKKKGKLT